MRINSEICTSQLTFGSDGVIHRKDDGVRDGHREIEAESFSGYVTLSEALGLFTTSKPIFYLTLVVGKGFNSTGKLLNVPFYLDENMNSATSTYLGFLTTSR